MTRNSTRMAPNAAFYSADAYCVEESVGYLMKRIMLSVVYQVDKRLCLHELTNAQWGPLMHLRTTGGSTIAELARWSQVNAGAMTRLVDRLEKKGLCKRVRSNDDRRVVNVELTPEGSTAIGEVPAVLSEVMNAHLSGFTSAEGHILRTLLKRMVENGNAMRQSGERDAARP